MQSGGARLTGALVPTAQQNNWQLTTIIQGACPFSTASEVVPDEPDCLAWNAAAAAEITTLHPEAVITLASRDVRAGLTEQTPRGFVEQWRRLEAQGIPVLALRDNPRFHYSIPDCVQQRPEDVHACGVNRADVYAPVPPRSAVPDIPSNVSFVDIFDAVCEPDRCPAVIGNVLVTPDVERTCPTSSQRRGGVVERIAKYCADQDEIPMIAGADPGVAEHLRAVRGWWSQASHGGRSRRQAPVDNRLPCDCGPIRPIDFCRLPGMVRFATVLPPIQPARKWTGWSVLASVRS